jgi:hypothetical protein
VTDFAPFVVGRAVGEADDAFKKHNYDARDAIGCALRLVAAMYAKDSHAGTRLLPALTC